MFPRAFWLCLCVESLILLHASCHSSPTAWKGHCLIIFSGGSSGVSNLWIWGKNLLFAENSMKMKKNWTDRGRASLTSPWIHHDITREKNNIQNRFSTWIKLTYELCQFTCPVQVAWVSKGGGWQQKIKNKKYGGCETLSCWSILIPSPAISYRSGTVNSKSFVGKVLLRIKSKFKLN